MIIVLMIIPRGGLPNMGLLFVLEDGREGLVGAHGLGRFFIII